VIRLGMIVQPIIQFAACAARLFPRGLRRQQNRVADLHGVLLHRYRRVGAARHRAVPGRRQRRGPDGGPPRDPVPLAGARGTLPPETALRVLVRLAKHRWLWSGTDRNWSKSWGWGTSRAARGAGFIITRGCALRRTVSWWPRGFVLLLGEYGKALAGRSRAAGGLPAAGQSGEWFLC